MKHFINNGDMKAANTRDVFSLIRRHGSLTRKQIEEYTRLSWGTVSNITARLLETGYLLEEKAENLMKQAYTRLNFSARAYNRIMKVARTIADLDGSDIITAVHMAEAIQYRTVDKKYWGD